MANDPRRLRPSDLCRLLNSTPLGEVVSAGQLRTHRTRAGLRIGDARHVDLVRYVAWLVLVRHEPRTAPRDAPGIPPAEAAAGAAALASSQEQVRGHGQKLTGKQEAVIAALLTEPTYASAAAAAGISEATLYRWLNMPTFRAAYRASRRELIEVAIGRIQAATGQAVEALVTVARQGRRDGDRVRASVALLEHAFRGLHDADLIHGRPPIGEATPAGTSDVVTALTAQLRQIEQSELPAADKARLIATVADSLLRAIGVDVLDKRLEAMQAVLTGRKEPKKRCPRTR